MRARVQRLVVTTALALAFGALSACSTTLGDVPLPGTGVSGDTIRIDAEFQEALNLAKGATVKVNGINSGKVQEVFVEDFHARAEMLVRSGAELRSGATARLRYTTPLGELFVDVTNPPDGALLVDGGLITLEDSSTAPTVEDALSQASLLVNGGGLGDLQTVTEELNTVLGGREDTARSLLERSRTFLVEANATTQDIDRALRSLVSVSTTLQRREWIINRAVREIEPAAVVLRRNTPGLTTLLEQVERFSGAAENTVIRTRKDLLQVLDQVTPVLAEFTSNRAAYPLSLDALITLANAVDGIVPGDYVGISLAVRLDGTGAPDLGGALAQLGIDVPDLPELSGAPGPRGLPGGHPGGLLDALSFGGLVRSGGR